jgi:hypothetical protein
MSRFINPNLFALAGLSFALTLSQARAATISIEDSPLDFEAQHRSNDGTYPASEAVAASARVGFQSNFNGAGSFAPGGIESVFLFKLPALGVGESVTNATFSIGRLPDTSTGAVTPTFNGDLYALGVTATAPAISSNSADAQHLFYLGDTAQSSLPVVAGSQVITGPVSRVTDNFFVPSMFIANGGSAAPLDVTDVTTYIQGLYANPVGNGFIPGTSYLVMRINPDTATPPTTGTQRYFVGWQGPASGTGNPGSGPFVTLTTATVPEPASLALMALSLAGCLSSARRRG